jgi:hypothetical protein
VVFRSIFWILLIGAGSQSFAQTEPPQFMTVDGRLYDSTAPEDPLLDNSVLMKIQILNPAKTCILYEEEQTVSTLSSNGYFNVRVGSPTSGVESLKRTTSTIDVGNSMMEIFQNQNAAIAGKLSGGAGCSYTPSAGDTRYFRFIVTPSTTGMTSTLSPDMQIDSVPQSLVAETLQGMTPANFVQTNTDVTQAKVNSLFGASYAGLSGLLAGSSSLYLQNTTNGTVIPSRATNPAAPTAGQIWYDSDDFVMRYYDGTSVITLGTSGGDPTKLPLAGGTMAGAIDMATNDITDVGHITQASQRTFRFGVYTTAQQATLVATPLVAGHEGTVWYNTTTNKLMFWDGTAEYAVAPVDSVFGRTGAVVAAASDYDANQIDNTPAGTVAATEVQAAINELDSEKVAKAGDTMTGALNLDNEQELRLSEADGSGANYVGIKALNALGANYTLTLPGNAGSASQVLTTDGTGLLSWTSLAAVGESNTASNQGAAGVGVYDAKSGVDLQFRNINAASNKVSVALDAGNKEIDINVNEANLNSGVIPNTAAGTIAATNVQAAINELDTDKVATTRAINTVAGSGLAGGGDLSADRSLSVNINGTTAETVVAGVDEILIYDASATALRKMTRTNFVLSETEVDAMVSNNGYLTTEADTLATVTGRGASTATSITLNTQAQARFADSAGGEYAAIQAPATIGTNYVLTLPDSAGTNGQVLTTNGAGVLNWTSLAAVGETNTASNQGAAGVGLYDAKSGVDLQFRNINAASNKVSVALDAGNKEVDINVNEANFALGSIPNTAAGTIVATNAQAAINELDTDKVAKAGDTMTGALNLDNEQELRLSEADGSGANYVAIKALTTLGANYTLTLPANDGDTGQYLQTDGNGVLAWVTPAGVGETNTASNQGAAGVGVFKQKTTFDLEFRNINAASNKISVALDAPNNEIDINVAEVNLDLGAIPNTPAGTIAATTAQTAINELDTDKVAKIGDTMTGALTMAAQSQARFADSAGGEYAAIQAPTTIGTNYVLTLPDTAGSASQVLTTNGSGVLSWTTPSTVPTADSLDFTHFADAMTLDANTSITSSGTNALSFINTGTGNSFLVEDVASDTTPFVIDASGNVGIGTTTPSFALSMGDATAVDGAIIAQGYGANGTGATLSVSGAGKRMIWYPRKSAFRAGNVNGTQWDDANIGNNSIALGYNTRATNTGAIAIGDTAAATSVSTTAIGLNVTSSGGYSTAVGVDSTASGSRSHVFGSGTASGTQSTALGADVTASGTGATALGFDVGSSGTYSVGIGAGNAAGAAPVVSGNNSVGIFMGDQSGVNVSTANVMSILGGNVGIGTTLPGTILDAAGAITSRPSGTGTGQTGQLIMRELAASPGGSDTVAIRAPDSVGTSYALTLPDTAGSAGQVLSTNGSGLLSWIAPGSTISADSLNFTDLADALVLDASTDISVTGTDVFSVTNSGTGSSFRVNDQGTDTTPFVIDNAGNAGVGTTAPSEKLEVYDGNIELERTTLGTNFIKFYNSEGTDEPFGQIGLEDNGTSAYVRFTGGAITGANNFLGYTFENGSVGIGTTAPGTLLDVAGAITSRPSGTGAGQTGQIIMRELAAGGTETATIRAPDALGASYALTLPIDDGTSGQVLSTDGSGVLSWVSAGGGGDFLANGSVAMTGQFQATSGTAAAPGITFDGDENTGIWHVNNNYISFSINTINLGGFSSSGFGVNGVVDSLITGGGQFNAKKAGLPAGAGELIGTYNFKYMNNSPSAAIQSLSAEAWTSGVSEGSHLTFLTSPNGTATPTEKLRVTSAGSVGIGTTIPGTILDAAGAITSRPSGTGTGQTGQLIMRELAAGGSETATIRAPDALGASYALTLPIDDGAAGQVLSTDGSGLLSWIAPGSTISADSLNFTDLADALVLDASTDISVTGTDVFSVTNSGTGSSFRVNDQVGDTTPFIIDASGNVGIGTTIPGYPLDVVGTVNSTTLMVGNGAIATPSITFASETNTGFYRASAGNIGVSVTGVIRYIMNDDHIRSSNGDGFRIFNGSFPSSATTPVYTRGGDTNTGIFFPGADELAVTTGGVERLRFDSVGSVGIGTTAPGTILDAAGAITSRPSGTGTGQTGQLIMRELAASPGGTDTVAIRAPDSVGTSYALTLPDTAGSASQVLTTNGAGILSWTTPLTSNTALLNGGNTNGAAVTMGTNDTFGVNIETDDVPRLQFHANRYSMAMGKSPDTPVTTNGTLFELKSGNNGSSNIRLNASVNSTTDNAINFLFTDTEVATIRSYKITPGVASAGLVFSTHNGTALNERFRITETGNVGVGTSVPSTLLDIAGAITSRPNGTGTGQTGQLMLRELAVGGSDTVAIRAPDSVGTSYALTLPDTAGSVGQVLSTNGSGLLSWIAPGSTISADSLNFTDLADALVLDASTDISVTGTNALSITNTGTGDSFRVNDAAGDTNPFIIDQSGNVGIGTTVAGRKVHVLSSASSYVRIERATQAGGEVGLEIMGGTGGQSWAMYQGTSSDDLKFYRGGDIMTLTASGNVGIGTTAPSSTMHIFSTASSSASHPVRAGFIVEGEGNTSGHRIASRIYSDTEGPQFVGYRARGTRAAPIALQSGDELLTINAFGLDTDAGASTNWTNGTPSMRFIATQNFAPGARGTGIIFSTVANNTASTAERLRIDNNGNVGVGTTIPSTLLDIAGAITSRPSGTGTGQTGQLIMRELAAGGTDTVAIRAPDSVTTSFSLTLPGTAGASGQVLRTDGAGVLSWVDATANSVLPSQATHSGKFLTTDGTNTSWAQPSVDGLSDGILFSASTFIGTSAGTAATGSWNTGFGYRAMQTITTDTHNVAFGADALRFTTSGSNTAVGALALRNNAAGQQNAAFGRSALDANVTGSYNTSIGTYSLASFDAGDGNTVLGSNSMRYFVGGANNTAIGYNSGQGASTVSTGSNNTLMGYAAGNNLELADSNTIIGSQAGQTIINGDSNIFIGQGATWTGDPSSKLNIGNTIYGDLATDSVGIGTTAPATALDIAGAITSRPYGTASGETGQLMLRELAASPGGTDTVTIRAPNSVTTSFNLTLPGTAGSTGQVLQTDGTGILSWINAASSVADDSLNFDKLADALALDASTDIGLDGAEILSITNIGTANSFVVNDQAGDTSPFVIDTNGNVGIGTTTASSKLEVNGRIVSSLVSDADALTSVTVDFSAANVIDATGASAACGTLNITNTVSGGSFTVTIPNATATCTTIHWNGSATGVKLPAGYAGGIASAGLVYSFVHSGSLLWVTNVTY